MAPFRASRSTRSDRRTGTHAEADVFDGLPVRQWQLHESIVAPPPSLDSLDSGYAVNVPPGHLPNPQQQRNARPFNKWTAELPMPKGSELYAPWCQQLLRAARAGRIRKRSDEDGGSMSRDEEKDNGEDGDGQQQNELKGFMARRWTQLPRQMERPEPEYLAKRRKGLASVVPLPGMPGMSANDGQGAAAEGALNQPVVEERKRNMPPRRKPKKGPNKKKKMSDGAGLGVSASAEALAASHASHAKANSNGENGTGNKTDGEDVTMQDAEDGDEDGDEGDSGDEEGDEDGEESEATPQPSEASIAAPRTTDGADTVDDSSTKPQHPLATETSATEAMAEPTSEDPQAPPPIKSDLAMDGVESSPLPKLEHDLVPELTDEPPAEENRDEQTTENIEAIDTLKAEASPTKEAAAIADAANVPSASVPISAAQVQAALQSESASETPIKLATETTLPLADSATGNALETEAIQQDSAAGRDDDAQIVPPVGLDDTADTGADRKDPALVAAQVPPPEPVLVAAQVPPPQQLSEAEVPDEIIGSVAPEALEALEAPEALETPSASSAPSAPSAPSEPSAPSVPAAPVVEKSNVETDIEEGLNEVQAADINAAAASGALISPPALENSGETVSAEGKIEVDKSTVQVPQATTADPPSADAPAASSTQADNSKPVDTPVKDEQPAVEAVPDPPSNTEAKSPPPPIQPVDTEASATPSAPPTATTDP